MANSNGHVFASQHGNRDNLQRMQLGEIGMPPEGLGAESHPQPQPQPQPQSQPQPQPQSLQEQQQQQQPLLPSVGFGPLTFREVRVTDEATPTDPQSATALVQPVARSGAPRPSQMSAARMAEIAAAIPDE